jgi:hypothetical protein
MTECWKCGVDLDEEDLNQFRADSGEQVTYCPLCEALDPHDDPHGDGDE